MKRLLLSITLMFASIVAANAQSIIYVNNAATGTGIGKSWANAYTGFQNAINAAVAGDTIWVAKGTYQPAVNGFLLA